MINERDGLEVFSGLLKGLDWSDCTLKHQWPCCSTDDFSFQWHAWNFKYITIFPSAGGCNSATCHWHHYMVKFALCFWYGLISKFLLKIHLDNYNTVASEAHSLQSHCVLPYAVIFFSSSVLHGLALKETLYACFFRLCLGKWVRSCAAVATWLKETVSPVPWTALWKPCPSAFPLFPSAHVCWSTWERHTTSGFALLWCWSSRPSRRASACIASLNRAQSFMNRRASLRLNR